MATPSVPAAPPAAAPSTPAPAAPASSTPATPSATPATPAAPAAAPAAAVVPAPEPKNTDYPGNTDGQVKFLAEHKKWTEAQKDQPAKEAVQAIAETLGAQPGEVKPAAEAKPEGEAKPSEAKPEGETKPTEPALPKQLADLLDAKPERKAFIDADPELKGAIYANARQLANAQPILELVPTRADAEFMSEHTTALVGMKTASMRMIDMPETAPQVLGLLDQQFAVVDKDGKPVLGQDGKPTYAEDRRPFLDAVVSREVNQYKEKFSSEMKTLEAKLKSGVYPNEAAKAADQMRFDRLEIANAWADMWDQIKTGEIFKGDVPEIPADASPEFKAWAEAEKKRLAEESAEIDKKKAGASKEGRQAEKQEYSKNVRGDMGTVAGKLIGEELKAKVDAGLYIPEFYMQEKYVNPETGQPTNTSAIVARIFMAWENELNKAGSRSLYEITQHELLPPTEQTREVRRQFYARKAAELLPGLIQKEVDRIQGLVKVDQGRMEERLGKRTAIAQPEPHTGGSGTTTAASENQLLAEAEEMAKKLPGFQSASPGDKQAMVLTQLHRRRAGQK